MTAADTKRAFDIPAGEAAATLKRFSEQSGESALFLPEQVTGVVTKAVAGTYTAKEALDALLDGTTLYAVPNKNAGGFAIKRGGKGDPNGARAAREMSNPPRKISGTQNASQSPQGEGILNLPKFEVSASRDVGYFSTETLAGTRSAKALVDVPGSIAIINREMIDDFNTSNFDDVLKYGVSGVTPNDEVIDDLNIRGFRQVNPFRDGVESVGAMINQTYDLERLEVVKGPSAMVFGNTSVLGGTVNFVSRKPTAIPIRDIKVTVGDNSYVRGEVNLSGPVTEKKDIRYRLTLGGQLDDRTKEIESDDQLFAGGAMTFDFGNTTLSLYGYHFNKSGYTYYNDFLDNRVTQGVMQLNPYSTKYFGPARSDDVFTEQNEDFLSASWVTQLNHSFLVKAFYRYRNFDDYRNIIRGTIPVGADNYTLPRQNLPYHQTNVSHVFQFDALYQLKRGIVEQEFSAGADYSRMANRLYQAPANALITSIDTRNPNFSGDASLPRRAYNFMTETTDEISSAYLQDIVSVWEKKLQLVGGVRWVSSRRITENYILGPTATTVNDVPTEPVTRYGLIVQPLKELSVYYVEADTFSINDGVNHLGVPLKNSAGTITEFGAKAQGVKLFRGLLFSSVAFFEMALTNVRTQGAFIPELGLIEILQSAQDSSKGYEFDIGYHLPLENGELTTIFTYYRAETRTATGFRPKNAAERVASLMLKFRFLSGFLKGFDIGGGWYAEGDKFGGGQLYMDSEDIYDVFASYQINRHWKVGVNVRNLTDERFATSYFNAGLVSSNDPRSIRFNVKYLW